RTGTELLAQALPIAWKSVPDLTMVWTGRYSESEMQHWRSLWGKKSEQILVTGPVRRAELQVILRKAECSVLPSQVDNLPNTVIESLMNGIPVIGTRGASVDELVEDGVNGHLGPVGDSDALAQ